MLLQPNDGDSGRRRGKRSDPNASYEGLRYVSYFQLTVSKPLTRNRLHIPSVIPLDLQSIYMSIMCIWPCFRFLTSEWHFLTPKITSDDLEMHSIKIRMKFGIDWYAYHVHLAIFPIFNPKMTFCDLQDDLGWPRFAHYWIQKIQSIHMHIMHICHEI